MGHSITLLPTWRQSWARLKALRRARHVARRKPMSSSTPLYQRAFWRTTFSFVSGMSTSSSRGSAAIRIPRAPRAYPSVESSVAPAVGYKPSACSVSRRTNSWWPRQICARRKQSSKTGRTRRATRGETAEPGDAAALADDPCDRDTDEDGRLLDGAHTAAHVETVEVGEGQRHALVGEAPAPGEHVGRDPPVRVRIGDRVRVADADVDARRVMLAVEERAEKLRAERPVELVGLPPRPRHGDDREPLLLPGREALTEPTHQLGRGDAHGRVRCARLVLFRRDDDVELAVRVT